MIASIASITPGARAFVALAFGALAFALTDVHARVSSSSSRTSSAGRRRTTNRQARRWRARARARARGRDDDDVASKDTTGDMETDDERKGARRRAGYALGVIIAPYGDDENARAFDGKALALVHGKHAFARAFDSAKQAKALDRVVVVTDDYRVSEIARGYNAEVVMVAAGEGATGRGGRERSRASMANEAARATGGGWDYVCVIGADEPLVESDVIDACAMELERSADEWCVACVAVGACEEDEIASDARPKCVFDAHGFAMYFSRTTIPARRFRAANANLDASVGTPTKSESAANYWHQLGVAAYDADYLRMLCASDPTPLQRQERLEVLNTLENGYKIKVVKVDYAAPNIQTPADIPRVEAVLAKRIEEKRQASLRQATLKRKNGAKSADVSANGSPANGSPKTKADARHHGDADDASAFFTPSKPKDAELSARDM